PVRATPDVVAADASLAAGPWRRQNRRGRLGQTPWALGSGLLAWWGRGEGGLNRESAALRHLRSRRDWPSVAQSTRLRPLHALWPNNSGDLRYRSDAVLPAGRRGRTAGIADLLPGGARYRRSDELAVRRQ